MKPFFVTALSATYLCAVTATASPFQEKHEGFVSHVEQNSWLLNKQLVRSAPGLVVYDESNRIVAPSAWPKQSMKVIYQLDLYGQLWRVWVITQNPQ